jgi:hypothetical protein
MSPSNASFAGTEPGKRQAWEPGIPGKFIFRGGINNLFDLVKLTRYVHG